MKDQLRLLRDCINNDRPAVVFQGDDFCAPEILEAAKEIYRKHGCSEEFLFDWQLLINEVKAYQLESPATVKLPKLSPTETENDQQERHEKVYREEAIKKQIEFLQRQLDEMHPENVSDVRKFEQKIEESGMNETARKEAEKIGRAHV